MIDEDLKQARRLLGHSSSGSWNDQKNMAAATLAIAIGNERRAKETETSRLQGMFIVIPDYIENVTPALRELLLKALNGAAMNPIELPELEPSPVFPGVKCLSLQGLPIEYRIFAAGVLSGLRG